MSLLLAIAVVTLPLGRAAISPASATTAMHVAHQQDTQHHHGAGHASVPHCPLAGSDVACDMACGVTQCEFASLDCGAEAKILNSAAIAFGPPLNLLTGLGLEPPDQPPRS